MSQSNNVYRLHPTLTGYAHSRGWCENGDRNSAPYTIRFTALSNIPRYISYHGPMVRMMVSNVQDFFASEGSIRLGVDDEAGPSSWLTVT